MIPYPETMMEPNRSNFLALGAIVGRGKIAGPEKWPEWDRLVEKYGWKLLLRCADMCEPEKRWAQGIEALCIAQKFHQEQEAKEMEARERQSSRPVASSAPDRAKAAEMFSSILQKKGLRP
jgi:hypothetical protein